MYSRWQNENKNLVVLTLNLWGLPLLSKEKSTRILAICDYLRNKSYDVVCFQEIWCKSDFQKIKELCSDVLPYAQYFYSGVFGSGLSIFSKWPIVKSFFSGWSVNGYCHMLHHGDWFGGKGVALAQLNADGLKINVYTTHLIAKYHENDCYVTHRVIQALDTALFVNFTSDSGDVSIICGDLNSDPNSLYCRLFQTIAQVTDAYTAANFHPDSLEEDIGTYECGTNSFTIRNVKGIFSKGTRIDYIFYKGSNRFKPVAVAYDMPLSHKIPNTDISFSDHEAVESRFRVHQIKEDSENKQSCSDITPLLTAAINICTEGEATLNYNFYIYGLVATILFMILNFFNNSYPDFAPVFCIIFLPIVLYLLFMVTVWYKLEHNSILGAKIRLANLKERC